MSMYFGGKKVKEMYWAGRKVKEAWYGGKKVFSSGGRTFGKWYEAFDYVAGDRVVSNGIMYECIKSHTSDKPRYASTNRPGYGWDEYTYWKQIGYAHEFGF
ncbi:Uncharacterised protein [Corynebacterium striatum]|nr:Uncharacterised protein [Corynebacterium striatum]